MKTPKKPRDNRLRECFQITEIEGVGERVICLHCSDYDRTLTKFNATKARQHLTDQCVGVNEEMREMFLQSSQAAKKQKTEMGLSVDDIMTTMPALPSTSHVTSNKEKKRKSIINRQSSVYLSFYLENESIIVTAPVERGELILHLAFPRNELNLKFNAEKNLEGAAVVIDGFMNKKVGSWSASLRKVGCAENLGTAGDYCQWQLESESRRDEVKQILQSLVMI
eukprot:scaffold34415_cov143-Skeletonema_menzelii.AAC.3